MTVLIGADAVGRLEVTDEARGGKRVARLQEHLPHLPVVWPVVEETVELTLGVGPPAAGVEEWLQLVKVGVNVVTPASLALDVVEAALKPRDDEVEAEALNPPQR